MSSQSYAPLSPVYAPAPEATVSTAAAPASLDQGALGALGMQGSTGNAGVMEAIKTSSKKGKGSTSTPKTDPVAADRAQAALDLAGRFEVVADDFKGERLSNQVTKAEYEKICQTYSDVRLGRGDLTIDASQYSSKKDQDAYKSGALNDIASLLQTKAGRSLVYGLSDNKFHTDSKGNPVHKHTTLTPLLTDSGKVDKTNGYAAPNGAGSDAKVNRDGTLSASSGTDVTISYNPGVNVGDAYKEYQGANPWLKGFRSDTILMHEGNHALKMTQGMCDPRTVASTDNKLNPKDPLMAQDARSGISRTEHQAVGLGLYANDPMTENAYRAERVAMAKGKAKGTLTGDADLTQRTSYAPAPPTSSRAIAAPTADPFAALDTL